MAELVATALTSDGYEADFTPASLWEIDRFFDEQTRKGGPRRWGLLAQDTGLRLFSIGGYVGEVIRRDVGGEWESYDADPEARAQRRTRLPDGSIVWPVQRAIERMRNGAEAAIVPYASRSASRSGPKPKR